MKYVQVDTTRPGVANGVYLENRLLALPTEKVNRDYDRAQDLMDDGEVEGLAGILDEEDSAD